MADIGKPFCVKGGECIGNVPTVDDLREEINALKGLYLTDEVIDYTLVSDGEWHDIDMSGVVGVDTKVVMFLCSMMEMISAGKLLELKAKGGVIDMMRRIRVESVYPDYFQAFISVSDAKIFSYRTDCSTVVLYVLGWC